MNRMQAKEYIKNGLESYLAFRGINTRKAFRCLNPRHNDAHPSMRYDKKRKRVHCFACGADYDTFDVIGIDYGLISHSDIFKIAYKHFGVVNNMENQRISGKNREKAAPDYTDYFREMQRHIHETDYAKKRGLSDEIISFYRLGYDSHYDKGTGGAVWKALIIPTGKRSFVARNCSPADERNRIRKQGASPLYNLAAAMKADRPIFVVEGEIDALSVIEAGGNAIALGSAANYIHLLSYFKDHKPSKPVIVCLDNDSAGEDASQKLLNGLRSLSVTAYGINIAKGYKDANEALIGHREVFVDAVRRAGNIEFELEQEERDAYLKTNADAYLKEFVDGITESVNTRYISTGFPKLDALLEGGLYEGLYIMGAISSLGKTTLVTQIADQTAAEGTDVLLFSLEMARSEIMAKSISRISLRYCLANSLPTHHAKTTRGITTGKRYAHYGDTEKEVIGRSVEAYGKYASRIYISEGIGNMGVGQIREHIEKHVRFTGNTPVVIVDYLQIIAPYNDRASDKQNTDKAVLELKRISRDFKLPVIVISSFNRQNYREAVTMEAFKESGAIEYSSDVLIGLQLKGAGQKDFDVNAEKKKNPRQIELKILKNRNGATGDAILYEYYPLFNYFKES